MNRIKLKQLMKLVANLEVIEKNLSPKHKRVARSLAKDLQLLMLGAENVPHPGPGRLRYVNAGVSDTLRQVQQSTGEKLVLIGGAAVIHWVQIRETEDLDYAVLAHDLPKIKAMFPGGEYTVHVGGVAVDFMHANLFPWASKAIATAVKTNVMGIPTRVALPEYLILFKLQASRTRDEGDVKALLTLKGVAGRARPLVKKYLPDFLDGFNSLVLASDYGV